jgi:hypothetical protein
MFWALVANGRVPVTSVARFTKENDGGPLALFPWSTVVADPYVPRTWVPWAPLPMTIWLPVSAADEVTHMTQSIRPVDTIIPVGGSPSVVSGLSTVIAVTPVEVAPQVPSPYRTVVPLHVPENREMMSKEIAFLRAPVIVVLTTIPVPSVP